ncbi:hypothetical protein RSOLAG1IB_00245 [Rhizoctonia solani AG-1 IB]|uniref:Uncharacterized protein n=1 Tax=Thanatephorus cucumeris (strain AG1-IB / isolate 7/3/14) TaxID=1108050 RepID=A0A0B7F2I7_THACB|nr:hypothetical protein RSOLAG1IB_00245 [Rhizoctonia solani AG-1 IB]
MEQGQRTTPNRVQSRGYSTTRCPHQVAHIGDNDGKGLECPPSNAVASGRSESYPSVGSGSSIKNGLHFYNPCSVCSIVSLEHSHITVLPLHQSYDANRTIPAWRFVASVCLWST